MTQVYSSIPLFEEMDFRYSNQANGVLDQKLTGERLTESGSVSQSYKVIYPQFRILSADTPTRNCTLYTLKAHKGKLDEESEDGRNSTGQYSFTRPFGLPLIKEHNTGGGFFGGEASETYGRIIEAKVLKNKDTGVSYLAGLGEVSHAEAVEAILTGRWLTGSLGSEVLGGNLKCGVCEHTFIDAHDMYDHEHQKGKFYKQTSKGGWDEAQPGDKDAKLCTLNIDSYKGREYSQVLVPSDVASQVQVRDTSNGGGNFGKRDESAVALWVPMSKSSATGVEEFGSRYLDLASGRQVEALDLGMRSGVDLYEHLEELQSLYTSSTPIEESTIVETPVITIPVVESIITPDLLIQAETSKAKFLSVLKYTRLTSEESAKNLRPELLRIGRRKGWSPRENIKENLLDPKNPKGAFALELAYKTLAGQVQTFSFLPRATEADRASSLKLLESEEVLSSLGDESETALKSLLSAEAAGDEDAVALSIDESNFSLFIALNLPESTEEFAPVVDPAIEALKLQVEAQTDQMNQILALLKTQKESVEETEEPVLTPDRPPVATYKMVATKLEKELLSQTELEALSDDEIMTKIAEFYAEAPVLEPVLEDTSITELGVKNPLLEPGTDIQNEQSETSIPAKATITLGESDLDSLHSLSQIVLLGR